MAHQRQLRKAAALLAIALAAATACSKKGAPQPAPAKQSIRLGSYRIVKDQGSDNGDTVYYTRTISDCEAAARFTFTEKRLTVTSPCTPPDSAFWSYDSGTRILTLTNGNPSSRPNTILIEGLSGSGFIWNAIATSSDNARYTMQLAQ